MGKRVIDYDRGVSIRQCDKPQCFQVFMYKDEPGVYLNVFGQPVPDEIAAEAGFDTKELGKAKAYRERMAIAMKEIADELQMTGGNDSVVQERDGLKIVKYGHAYHIKDAAGNVITAMPLPLDQAKLLFDKLVPPAPKEKPAAREKARKEAENE